MTSQEVWNIIDIIFLVLIIFYNFYYYKTHTNGKKLIRLISGAVLSIVLVLRFLILFHTIHNDDFQQLLRPWALLVYLLPAMDCYVDWHRNQKNAS